MYGRNSHQIRHYALVMLLFALTLRVPAIADAGESKPVQLNNANTVRQPRFLRASDGRNTRTRRGEIGTSSPVLGFRPMRSLFSLT